MIKKIPATVVIEQTQVVNFLNSEIDAMNWHEANKKPFIFRPKLMTGPAGTGKGHITETFAEICFSDQQYLVFPPNGGIGDFKEVQGKMVSIDNETDACSAIPSTLFVDECQKMNGTVEEILKLLINKPVGMVHRTGKTFFHDQRDGLHKTFFASNEMVDKAIVSRCDILETTYYSRQGIERHLKRFLQKPITDEALEFCVNRLKPIGRDVQAAVVKLDQQPTHKIGMEHARAVIIDIFGLNPGGIARKDMRLLKRLAQGTATIDVLKWSCDDQVAKQTKERADWLQHLGYLEPFKHNGFLLTKKGAAYLEEIAKLQKAQKLAKAKLAK